MFFKIVQVYLHFVICRVYKGHLKNKWVITTFQKHLKSSKFVWVSPVFSSCKMYTLFVEIQRYLEIPRIHFCETSHSKRQAPKVSVVKAFPKKMLIRAEIQFELNLLWCCCQVIFIANEQPREDVRLQGSSLIELCAIVPGAEKISNRCNID